MAVSGDYCIVGSEQKEINGSNSRGKAYIFLRTESGWVEQSGLTASDGAALDYFGSSVSISGNDAIIGAYGHDIDGNLNQGKVYIFSRE